MHDRQFGIQLQRVAGHSLKNVQVLPKAEIVDTDAVALAQIDFRGSGHEVQGRVGPGQALG